MSSREERIEQARSVWGTPWEGCDPRVASAVALCTLEFTARDSLTSKVRGRSIRAKVEKFFDNTFAELAQEIGAVQSNWLRFSDLMEIETSRSDYALHIWGREAIQLTKTKFGARSSDYQRVRVSVDSCRDFNHLCHAYFRTRTAVLKPFRVGSETFFDRHEKRRSSRVKSYANIPFELQLVDEPWCELCPQLVESEEQKLQLTREGTILNSNLPLQIKSLSSRFCCDHSPSGGEKYKRDQKRRTHLYLMMRLLIEARLAENLSALDPETRHSIAYTIVCESGPVPKALRALHDDYFSAQPQRLLKHLCSPHVLTDTCCQIIKQAKQHGHKPHQPKRRGIKNQVALI